MRSRNTPHGLCSARRRCELAFEAIDDLKQSDCLVRAVTTPDGGLVKYSGALEPLKSAPRGGIGDAQELTRQVLADDRVRRKKGDQPVGGGGRTRLLRLDAPSCLKCGDAVSECPRLRGCGPRRRCE